MSWWIEGDQTYKWGKGCCHWGGRRRDADSLHRNESIKVIPASDRGASCMHPFGGFSWTRFIYITHVVSRHFTNRKSQGCDPLYFHCPQTFMVWRFACLTYTLGRNATMVARLHSLGLVPVVYYSRSTSGCHRWLLKLVDKSYKIM